MNLGFSFRNREEDGFGQLFLRRADSPGRINDLFNMVQMPMGMLLGMQHLQMQRSKAAAFDGFDFQFHTRQAERIDTGTNRLSIDTRINEGSQCHVAANTGRAVQISNAHRELPSQKWPFGGCLSKTHSICESAIRSICQILVLGRFLTKTNQGLSDSRNLSAF